MEKNGKLHKFLKQLNFFGHLEGFKHFELELRGKEELAIILKTNYKKRLRTFSNKQPASPSANEMPSKKTTFLLTAYVKYQMPLVFLRNGDGVLDQPIKLNSCIQFDSQSPWDVLEELLTLIGIPDCFGLENVENIYGFVVFYQNLSRKNQNYFPIYLDLCKLVK